GILLMLLTAIDKLIQSSTLPQIVGSIAVVVAVGIGLHLALPIFDMLGNLNLIVFFLVLVGVCLVIGMPIGIVFILATAAYLNFT
ncbi:hypothetical protein ABTM48_20705, partial [Acinetobacter baumannii]